MIRALVLGVLMAAGPALAADGLFGADGYRIDEYRGPVPDSVPGGTVVGTEAAHALWAAGVAFIDVLPRPPRPVNLPAGTIWHEKPRLSVPGAIWLPNVGYGAIAPVTEAYFRAGLEAATGGDMSRPLVIFCLEECWMSWNAAIRAAAWGYTAVHWMPDGTDGWAFFDYPLEAVEPMAGEPQTGTAQ